MLTGRRTARGRLKEIGEYGRPVRHVPVVEVVGHHSLPARGADYGTAAGIVQQRHDGVADRLEVRRVVDEDPAAPVLDLRSGRDAAA